MAKATPATDIDAAEQWRSTRVKKQWRTCWGCSIPQSELLNELRRRGWGVQDIIEFFVAKHGYGTTADTPDERRITRNKLQHHFGPLHHEQAS